MCETTAYFWQRAFWHRSSSQCAHHVRCCYSPPSDAKRKQAIEWANQQKVSFVVAIFSGYREFFRGRPGVAAHVQNLSFLSYAMQMCAAVGLSVAWCVLGKAISMDELDWFACIVFLFFAFTELLQLIFRCTARWTFINEHERALAEHGGLLNKLYSFFNHSPFTNCCQAIVVVGVQIFGSICQVFYFAVLMTELLKYDDGETTRHDTTHLLAFIFSSGALAFAAFGDALRASDLLTEGAHLGPLEIMATRSVLLTIPFPVLAAGFAWYATICCEGNLLLN